MRACASNPGLRSIFIRSAARAASFALLLAAAHAQAQFAAFVLPARFELTAKPGENLQNILEIGNDEAGPVEFRLRTADWKLREDAGVEFQVDTLAPDSCRPWVKLERYTIKLGGKAKRRFRFEVQVPADAQPGLCRFALLVESAQDAGVISPLESIRVPLQGRIGVIVYVRIGDARPDLVFERIESRNLNGLMTPVAIFTNKGNAHGRPQGLLYGSDSKGTEIDFTVSPLPILPGETRGVPIWPQDSAERRPVSLVPPYKLKGVIEWEGGKREIDTTVR